MLWIILGTVSAAYYAVVRYVALQQQMTGIWLVLAAVFFVLFLCRRFFPRIPIGKNHSLRIRTFCITSGVLLVFMMGVVAWRIFADMWRNPQEDLAFILLLNQNDLAAETDGEWEARLDEAVAYLEENEETKVIVSGGGHTSRGASEAHAMYGYLLEHGVDGSRIFWEIRSQGTKENLEYALSLVNGHREPVGIVSSDYSMYRTLRIARNQGYVMAEPISTPTTPWLYPHRIAQEILLVLRDKFFGVQ